VNKLPSGIGGVAKNLVMTKDSAAFRGLNRMVQYGDFVAKAALFEHLKETGMGERQALDQILEEFVQYNRLPGRGRDKLESLGVLWFYSYKLRILKVAARLMRERPVSFLAGTVGLGPMLGLDTPATGSVVGAVADGSWKYSLGWGMALNAPALPGENDAG
jgi:hypothetical protein